MQLILILEIIHDLPARAIDFVLAFLQAELDVPVFMELPVGCDSDVGSRSEYLIELKKYLYSLKQATFNWFNMLKEGLEVCGYKYLMLTPVHFYQKRPLF